MELKEAILGRRSIRKFKDAKVDKELIIKILDAAKWAPSAGNLQPWEVIIVENDHTKKLIAEAALGQYWLTKAPIVLIVCANLDRTGWYYGERGRTLYAIQDTAAFIQNILLLVHDHGLGACWVGAFDEEIVREILEIPRNCRPVAIIPIGIPDEKPSPPSRRPLEMFVHHEKFKEGLKLESIKRGYSEHGV